MIELFRHCFSRLPEATVLVSGEGLIIGANAAASELLRRPADLIGSPLEDVVLDTPAKVGHLLALSRRSRDLIPGALTFRKPNGSGLLCRVEGALFGPDDRGGMVLLRLFSKEEATRPFQTLNQRIDSLNREVIERKRAQAELHIQQELLRATLLSIGDGVIATDKAGNATFLNQIAEALTGWAQADAQGESLEKLFVIHNEYTGAPVENPAQRALREGTVVGLANHTVLTSRDGRTIPIDDSAAPIRNAHGDITGVVLVFRDVSERKQLEGERQRLVSVVENSPNLIALCDIDHLPLYVNRAGLILLGAHDFQECQTIPLVNYFTPGERDFVRDVVLPGAHQDGAWRGELQLHHFRTGRAIPILYDLFRIDDPNTGKGINFAMIARDITEQKRAEEEMQRTAEFDEAVMANMGEGLFTIDVQGLVTSMNPAAQKLLGWSLDEMRGRTIDQILHRDHEGKPFSPEEFSTTDDAAPVRNLIPQEGVFLRNDGTIFDVVYSSSLLRSRARQILGRVVVFRDVSEKKRRERELRATNDALRRANEDLNQFAFAASHDLQEPLRMITSYSQLLIKGYSGQLNDEAAHCVDFITQGTNRMRNLLTDLLDYTQIGDNHQNASTVVDLNSVYLEALENCKTSIQDSGAVVTCEPLPSVRGHPPHFLQLLQNLLGNAIKYRATRPLLVHISALRINGSHRLAVADNGIGIAPHYHQQIFGVFKRLHGKEIPGTGIGLAICQRVVERYGGRIWVESQLDQGATFYCMLPAA